MKYFNDTATTEIYTTDEQKTSFDDATNAKKKQ
jgi:hypothetical protein